MNKRSRIACTISLLMSFSTPPLAFAQSANVATLLNQANQMNNQEQDEAKELRSKAGDNQALVTMADTLTQDHKANQAAVEALAKQENVTLESYKPNKAEQDRLDNLKGAQFNDAFLNANVRDHKEALATFRKAKTEMGGNPNVKVYIDQTIPVLESHLKMAENLRHDNKVMGSSENPENNKSTNRRSSFFVRGTGCLRQAVRSVRSVPSAPQSLLSTAAIGRRMQSLCYRRE